jgi:hypothetical protein
MWGDWWATGRGHRGRQAAGGSALRASAVDVGALVMIGSITPAHIVLAKKT